VEPLVSRCVGLRSIYARPCQIYGRFRGGAGTCRNGCCRIRGDGEGGAMVNPFDIMPVLALAALIAFIPLLSEGPP
jgi:hypothetical protein